MRKYITQEEVHHLGWPNSLHYECIICGAILDIRVDKNKGCRCGNVYFDNDGGRIAILDETKVKRFLED